jgi:hypothetical protein
MTEVLIVASLIAWYFFGYSMGRASIKRIIASKAFEEIQTRAMIPVCVAECVEKNYYLYEKDTDKFMCQAPSLEELPKSLFDTKKINLALVLFPSEANNEHFWIINGKIKKLEAK